MTGFTYAGVDPGKNGAIAIVRDGQLIECHDMPSTTAGLLDTLIGLPCVDLCALEKAIYPHQIGITNAAKIAEAYGALRAALTFQSIPFREVRPAEWKKKMHLSSSKNASREAASQRFPDRADLFKRVKDDGRAEAALLAVYASEGRVM